MEKIYTWNETMDDGCYTFIKKGETTICWMYSAYGYSKAKYTNIHLSNYPYEIENDCKTTTKEEWENALLELKRDAKHDFEQAKYHYEIIEALE